MYVLVLNISTTHYIVCTLYTQLLDIFFSSFMSIRVIQII